jgi:uroporphyrinogen-III decarboxylase
MIFGKASTIERIGHNRNYLLSMKFRNTEYIELMTFGDYERPMFAELFGPLVGLDNEWRAQGAARDEIDMTGFDWDYIPVVRQCGGNTGIFNGFQKKILEETGEHIIWLDELGRKMKICKGYATDPLPLDFPVKDMASWLKIRKLYEFSEKRIDWEKVEESRKLQKEGHLVVGLIPGGFDTVRELMGEVNGCLAYYLQPELIRDIIQTLTDTSIKVYERITERLVIDQLSVHEDMAGKNGPLIGPDLISEFIKPYFSAVWELLSSRGTKLFDMDSDGDMNPVLDILLETGLNAMHPFEPAAGMDIVEIRKKYGKRLAIRGGINKFALTKGKEEIRKELEYKMQPFMIDQGGIVFGLDHRIINGTTIENYRYYVNMGRKILNLPPLDSKRKGWARMAF